MGGLGGPPPARIQSGSLQKLTNGGNGGGGSSTGRVSASGHSQHGGNSVGNNAPPGSGTVRVPPFLTKLYTIMEDAQPDDYAGWYAQQAQQHTRTRTAASISTHAHANTHVSL